MELGKSPVQDEEGRKAPIVHQASYTTFITQDFADRFNSGQTLRRTGTPMWAREERDAEHAAGMAEEKVPG